MQRLNRTAFRQSARLLRRLMSTETKAAPNTSSTAATASVKETAAQAGKQAPKAAEAVKPGKPSNPTGAPKTPKAPKNGKKSGKGKVYAYTSLAIILGCGGLYRYHSNNDHLSCINKVKGGNNTNILETLYLAPKHLEEKYSNFMYTTYCDRLIYEIVHNNPMGFKNMEDVVDYFSKWFSTLGFEVDNNGAITEEALIDLFSEFSKDANAYYVYIIGERYFHISPMTDFMSQDASRYFDSQRIRRNKQYLIPMEKVLEIVEHLEEKNKETYFTSAFKPNFADKMFSSEARGVKMFKLVEWIKCDKREGMGVYEFVNLMAVIERQTKNKKFYFYYDNYVDRMVGESLFDRDMEEEEEEEEETEVAAETTETAEQATETAEQAVETPEQPVEVPEVKEPTLEDLLNDLERVNSTWWNNLFHANMEGVKNAREEEKAIREELKKMEWW